MKTFSERGRQAYFVVDLGSLDAETRQELLEDAMAGGQDYGVRVVEEFVNGSASVPVYGVYYNVEGAGDETKWAAAKVFFNITDEAVDKSADPNKLRQSAEARANATAEAQAHMESIAVKAVTGEDLTEEEKAAQAEAAAEAKAAKKANK